MLLNSAFALGALGQMDAMFGTDRAGAQWLLESWVEETFYSHKDSQILHFHIPASVALRG